MVFTLLRFFGKTASDSGRLITCLGHFGWYDRDRIISNGTEHLHVIKK
jgi:hypothetical protein